MSLAARLPAEAQALDLLASRPLVVLTGAGLSTDSGIPDYRGPGAPARAPMTYQEFVATPKAQQRYWARSHLGWQRMGRAEPNAGHHALAALDPQLLITQNVDGLQEAAGSSLTVMSGLRFVKRAAQGGTPIVSVNRGVTRGDALASYKLEVGCSEFLTELSTRVSCL